MKYCVLIIDGVSGWPLPDRDGKTSLELARTPDLDAMAKEGILGLARTIPPGMEASSACACMSVLGYEPEIYYCGRAAIEARSMGIAIAEGDAVFRCNLVAVRDGKMWSYSSGYISTKEAQTLIAALNEKLGNDKIHFYPGVGYRHICKIKGGGNTLLANCTPPHDIMGKPIADFLPSGSGSELLRELMVRSEAILREHPLNMARRVRGELPASMIWLFWGGGKVPAMPSFQRTYGLKAAMTSGVDLLRGLARVLGMEVLDIPGVTDGQDNDYAAQAAGALKALGKYDLVVVHIEAPDEAAHDGSIENKIKAIQRIDGELAHRLRFRGADLRLLIMPDHSTPIKVQNHTDDPVPFLLWGPGLTHNGAKRFTEAEAKRTGFFLEEGCKIMNILTGRKV